MVSSGCLWDPHADSFAISHYVNPTLFSMALVHAIYLESALWDEGSGTFMGPCTRAWQGKLSPGPISQ